MAHLRVLVGSPAAGALPGRTVPNGTLMLDLGPDHPSRAGLLEVELWTDPAGEVVERADVTVGAMHRGVEKLFEARDYRQLLALADRHDWQAPFAGELTVALACEDLLGLTAPPRAVWLRTLLAEHTRIASHLGFLGYLAHRASPAGRPTRTPEHTVLREELRRRMLTLTGQRIHPMLTRIGGLAADADEAWLDAEVAATAAAAPLAEDLAGLLDRPPLAAASGLASLGPATIDAYGVSGPAARASGVDLDLRRAEPYLAYADLPLTALGPGPEETGGDARARFRQLAAEVTDSVSLVAACAERLRDLPGPVAEPLPATLRLPEGETYRATEAPLGMAGAHVVSRGDTTPWRLHLRTPSFATVSALPAVLTGVPVAGLELALASLGYVVGDIDR